MHEEKKSVFPRKILESAYIWRKIKKDVNEVIGVSTIYGRGKGAWM